jgi:hypothetical protein
VPARIVDMTGKRYGNLTTVRLIGPGARARDMRWLFACDCGAEFEAQGNEVRRGGITACRECAGRYRAIAKSTHGKTHSVEYAAWTAMKRRCNNASSYGFEHYGGRGGSVCKEWAESFETFLRDMGRRPSELHSLDRIDPNGNYSKENCRWATHRQQANNKRTNRWITIDGVSRTLADWSRESGLSESCIRGRARRGITGTALITKSELK